MKISSGYGVRAGGVFNAPNVPEAPVVVYIDATGTPTIPKADIDRCRAKGMPVKWYGPTTPTSAHGAVDGDLYRGAVLNLGGGGGPTNLTVTYSGSTWSHTKAQVDAARATGGTIAWSTTSVAPTTANGLAVGDIVTSSAPLAAGSAMNPNTPITIQPAWAPAAFDGQGTSSDTITLTKVTGVTWHIGATAYPSSGLTGVTQAIPYTAGTNSTVTATADPGYEFFPDTMTSSWTLAFTDYTPAAGTLTSSNFSNYANGTTFTENSGSGVPLTMNNYDGGTQTAATAKYCNIGSGNLNLQNTGSFFSHGASPIGSTVTMEWVHRGRGGSGDTFMFPMYKGATGLGWGGRVTSGSLFCGGKSSSWNLGTQGYTTGADASVVAGDVLKLVATSTTMTAFVNENQVWQYGFAAMADNTSATISVGTTSGTSYSLDNYKFIAV